MDMDSDIYIKRTNSLLSTIIIWRKLWDFEKIFMTTFMHLIYRNPKLVVKTYLNLYIRPIFTLNYNAALHKSTNTYTRKYYE